METPINPHHQETVETIMAQLEGKPGKTKVGILHLCMISTMKCMGKEEINALFQEMSIPCTISFEIEQTEQTGRP